MESEDKKNPPKQLEKSNSKLTCLIPSPIVTCFLIAGVFTALVFQYNVFQAFEVSKMALDNCTCNLKESGYHSTYAVFGKSKSESHLKHVFKILDDIGYERVPLHHDWDLLWAHDYPFRTLSSQMKNLKNHQKVNHFPGCGYITNKVDLATSVLPYIPKAFRLPKDKDEFVKFSKAYPDKLFVEKHNEHRHIFIKSGGEINLESNSTFIQEFIQKPYLVDGYKFDIGVYVIITSINPLRVYIYKGDVLFRYCSEKYYPFDEKILNKYVVGDDYLPTWELPSLSHYYNNLKFSMKDSFDAYVRDNNQDPEPMWEKVEDIIRSSILAKEADLIESLKTYKKASNFFELMRFDLIIDENLKVYLLESNMSPNLSSAHFKQNSLLYEQVLYSLLNLIGIGSPVKHGLQKGEQQLDAMISSDKNIVVNANVCSKKCNSCTASSECWICFHCLSKAKQNILHLAFREHLQKSDTKRIFPKPINNVSEYKIEEEVSGLSSINEFMVRWYYGKCITDRTWCF